MENNNTYINLCELPARYYKKIYTQEEETNTTINDKDVIFFNKILSTDFNYGKTIIIERKSLLEYFKNQCARRNGRDLFGRTIKLQFKFRSDSVFNIVDYTNALVKDLTITHNTNTTFIPINMVANCSGDRFFYLSNSVANFDVESTGNAIEIIEPLTISTTDKEGNKYECIVYIGAEFESLKSDILVNLANKGLDDLTTHEFRAMNVSHNDTLNTTNNIDYAFMNDKYLQLLACYNVLLMSTGNIRALLGILKWFGYKDPKKILKIVRKWHPLISNFEKDTDGMLQTEKRYEVAYKNDTNEFDFQSFGTTNLFNLVLDLSEIKGLEITNDIDKTYRWRMYLLGLFMEAHFLPIHLGIDYSGVRENLTSHLNNDKTGNTGFKIVTNSHLYTQERIEENGTEVPGNGNNIQKPKVNFTIKNNGGGNPGNSNKPSTPKIIKDSLQVFKKYNKLNNGSGNYGTGNNITNNIIHIDPISDIHYTIVNYIQDTKNLHSIGLRTKIHTSTTKILSKGLVGTVLELKNISKEKIKNIRFFGSDYKTEHTGIYSFISKDFKNCFINYRTKYIRIKYVDNILPQTEYIIDYGHTTDNIKSDFNHTLISNLLSVYYIDKSSKKNESIIQNFTIKQITEDFAYWFNVGDMGKLYDTTNNYTIFKDVPDDLTVPVYKKRDGKIVRISKPGLNEEEIKTFYDVESTRIFTPLFFYMIPSGEVVHEELKGIFINFKLFGTGNTTFSDIKWTIKNNSGNVPHEYVTNSILLYNKGINKVELTGTIDGIEINWSGEFFI